MPLTTDQPILSVPVDRESTGFFSGLFKPSDETVKQVDFERAMRICQTAKLRGKFDLSLADLLRVQHAIIAARKRAQAGLGQKTGAAIRYWFCKVRKIDIYSVMVSGETHSFLWCRQSNRVISYICRGLLFPRDPE